MSRAAGRAPRARAARPPRGCPASGSRARRPARPARAPRDARCPFPTHCHGDPRERSHADRLAHCPAARRRRAVDRGRCDVVSRARARAHVPSPSPVPCRDPSRGSSLPRPAPSYFSEARVARRLCRDRFACQSLRANGTALLGSSRLRSEQVNSHVRAVNT